MAIKQFRSTKPLVQSEFIEKVNRDRRSQLCGSNVMHDGITMNNLDRPRVLLSYNAGEKPYSQARFPFKRNRLRCVRCVNENRKKRKRLRWQAASQSSLPLLRPSIPIGWRLRLLHEISATHATQTIAFEWKPGLSYSLRQNRSAWIGHSGPSVCLFVCLFVRTLQHNAKTNDTKVFKLGIS